MIFKNNKKLDIFNIRFEGYSYNKYYLLIEILPKLIIRIKRYNNNIKNINLKRIFIYLVFYIFCFYLKLKILIIYSFLNFILQILAFVFNFNIIFFKIEKFFKMI